MLVRLHHKLWLLFSPTHSTHALIHKRDILTVPMELLVFGRDSFNLLLFSFPHICHLFWRLLREFLLCLSYTYCCGTGYLVLCHSLCKVLRLVMSPTVLGSVTSVVELKRVRVLFDCCKSHLWRQKVQLTVIQWLRRWFIFSSTRPRLVTNLSFKRILQTLTGIIWIIILLRHHKCIHKFSRHSSTISQNQ